MAVEKIYPQDNILIVGVVDSVGDPVDLTAYENYGLFLYNEKYLVQKYSKVTLSGFKEITPIDEALGTFSVQIHREDLHAAPLGIVLGQVVTSATNVEFLDGKFEVPSDAVEVFELIKALPLKNGI